MPTVSGFWWALPTLQNLKFFTTPARIAISPTQLVGQVKGSDNVKTIPNALVQLRGSETQTFTDKEGKYVLSGIQAGTPTVQVSEQGVVKYTQKLKLIAGETTTANFPNPNPAS